MAANSWMSALPSAWKAPDFGTAPQAAEAGARTALTQVQAASGAVDQIRKQALQDAMGKAWRTAVGPNGKMIKVFDKQRFLEAAGPAGADAYKYYQDNIYGQEGKEAVQRGVVLDPTTGGVDGAQTARFAGNSQYPVDVIRGAQTLQKEQADIGSSVAQARQLTSTLATPGTARPGTPLGTDQMTVKSMDQMTTGTGADTVTPEQIAALSPRTLQTAILNIRAAGGVIADNASAADIAKAANSIVASEVQAGLGGLKSFSDLPSAVWNVNQTKGKTAQGVLGKIFGGELDTQAKKTALTRAQTETEGITRGVAKVEDTAKRLMIPVSKIGNTVDPETQTRVSNAESAVDALGNLDRNMTDIVSKIDSGEIKPNTVEGSNKLTAELVAQLGILSDIYGGSNTEGGIERALTDIGAPINLKTEIMRGGAEAALRGWVSNQATGMRDLLAGASRRAAHSVEGVLTKNKSSNPKQVLRSAGYGHLLPKSNSLPSKSGLKSGFDTPADGTPTRSNTKRGLLP